MAGKKRLEAGLLDDNAVIERVLGHIRNRSTDMGEKVWREPVENYSSEKRFASELKMLRRATTAFCPSAALPEKGSYVAREVQCVADDGRIAIIAVQGGVKSEFNAGDVLRRRLTITGSTLRPRPEAFKAAIAAALRAKVWPLIEAGRIKPIVHRVFDAAQAADAHALMESGAHVGKIVLRW